MNLHLTPEEWANFRANLTQLATAIRNDIAYCPKHEMTYMKMHGRCPRCELDHTRSNPL